MKPKNHSFFTLSLFALLIVFSFTAALAASTPQSLETTYVIQPGDLQGWGFSSDMGTGSHYFMPGPDTPPLGTGSCQLQIAGATDSYLLYKSGWGGVLLRDLSSLSYSTYHDPLALGEITELPYLVINIDYDMTDEYTDYQGRLVYQPFKTPGNTPVKSAWQDWDTLAGNWWATGSPGINLCPVSNPCPWSTVISNFPNAGILTTTPGIGFKVGSGWVNGFLGNVDKFVLGINGDTEIYDFEPLPPLVTALDLGLSTDTTSWSPVAGSYPQGYNLQFYSPEGNYFVNVGTMILSRGLTDAYYPFYIQSYPTGFFDYWADQGVVSGASGWQAVMWEIINGRQPYMYIKVAGADSMLVDGLAYQMYSTDTYWEFDSPYLAGNYTFSSTILDNDGYTNEVTIPITLEVLEPHFVYLTVILR